MMLYYKTLIIIVHLLSAFGVISFVLLQHGKGADMGTAFGNSASGSLFGASGSANFLSHTTAALATIFFVSTLALTHISAHRSKSFTSVLDTVMSTPIATASSAMASAPTSTWTTPASNQVVPK